MTENSFDLISFILSFSLGHKLRLVLTSTHICCFETFLFDKFVSLCLSSDGGWSSELSEIWASYLNRLECHDSVAPQRFFCIYSGIQINMEDIRVCVLGVRLWLGQGH